MIIVVYTIVVALIGATLGMLINETIQEYESNRLKNKA